MHDGRNNLGVISLNLPRIALEAKGDEATFWKLLDERLVLARKALMTPYRSSRRRESARRPDSSIWKVLVAYV
ncbi:anaerobic ribonucleoside-triphosphate reductase [Shigella flexneri]